MFSLPHNKTNDNMDGNNDREDKSDDVFIDITERIILKIVLMEDVDHENKENKTRDIFVGSRLQKFYVIEK